MNCRDRPAAPYGAAPDGATSRASVCPRRRSSPNPEAPMVRWFENRFASLQGFFATLGLVSLCALHPPVARAALPPLIPRSVFSSNPSFAGPVISHDGRMLAYLARSKAGTMNLWVRSLATGEQHPVSTDRDGDLYGARWAADDQHLLFVHDANGDENYHLLSLDIRTRQIRDLTPFMGVRAASILVSLTHPRQVLIGMNLRNRRVLDMYRVDLESGAVMLDTVNPGDVTEWAVDSAFVIRAC